MILPILMLIAAPADCDRDLPQQDLNICLSNEFGAADAELNRVWKPAYAAMQQFDRESPEGGYAQTLLASQRAWLAYRIAQCEAESMPMRGGSGEPMLGLDCQIRLTRERTRFLRGYVEGF